MAYQNEPLNGALKGLRVVDMTRVLAGPFCSMLLADMGAEVIKVEGPGKGDDARDYPPFLRGTSAYFANLNRNKQSIVLDLKDKEARRILIDLLKKSDVLLENFKPGTMDRLGLGYDTIREFQSEESSMHRFPDSDSTDLTRTGPGTTSSDRPWVG